jgi:pimeloyl-ACP methyl ester carboxylesterase
MDKAEAANDVDAINALEAHAWLDGPLERDGRIGGATRELFLAMNEIALRAEQRGAELPPAAAWTRLSEIRVPTLVTWGDLDFPHVADVGEHVARTIPHARRHVFKGTAHLPNLEQPVVFDRLLVDFCSAGATSGLADRPARP